MKKGIPWLNLLLAVLVLASCEKESKKSQIQVPLSEADRKMREQDMPLLQASPGDQWVYTISSFVPAAAYPEAPEERKSSSQVTLTFMGKRKASPELPETSCFRTSSAHFPDVLEFIDARDEVILMCGSLLQSEKPSLSWYPRPFPLVSAGMKAGMVVMESKSPDGKQSRKIEVIARENITVPAGRFRCIRFLTTSNDNGIETRKTMWYAPQHWIVREETIQYIGSKLMSRELRELTTLTRVAESKAASEGSGAAQPSGGK